MNKDRERSRSWSTCHGGDSENVAPPPRGRVGVNSKQYEIILNVLRIDRAEVFIPADSQLPLSEPQDAMLPQIGFIGEDYRTGGDILIGINSGGGGDAHRLTAEDSLLLPMIGALRTEEASFKAAKTAFGQYAANMRTWNLWREQFVYSDSTLIVPRCQASHGLTLFGDCEAGACQRLISSHLLRPQDSGISGWQMHFHIDIDAGDQISGWMAPDNPSHIPVIRVIVPGRETVESEASVMRPDIREAGLHMTGQVGFIVNDDLVPSLADQKEIEILDAATNIQIYRRNDPEHHIQNKMVYINASLMPQNKIYRLLNSRFAMNYNFVERHAFDTMACFINSVYIKSVVLTGRPYLSRYIGHFKNKGFFTSVLIGHPLDELAERLMFIQMIGNSQAAHLLPTFTIGFEPLVDFAMSLNFDDRKSMNSAFRTAKPEIRKALSNPLVRVLGCQPGEEPEGRHLGPALDNLSSVDAVGLREQFGEFKNLLNGLMGADVLGDSTVEVSPAVSSLADTLADIGTVNNLLEFDLVLHSYVEDAIHEALQEEIVDH